MGNLRGVALSLPIQRNLKDLSERDIRFPVTLESVHADLSYSKLAASSLISVGVYNKLGRLTFARDVGVVDLGQKEALWRDLGIVRTEDLSERPG